MTSNIVSYEYRTELKRHFLFHSPFSYSTPVIMIKLTEFAEHEHLDEQQSRALHAAVAAKRRRRRGRRLRRK